MSERRLQTGWPTRRVDVAVEGVRLSLRVPDNPYALLDLPAVERAFNEDEYMPYWAHLWPAGFMLGQWLIGQARASESSPRQADIPLPPKPALEIGCGLAVSGLLAARLGYRVTLSDYDVDALDFARRNAKANGLSVRVLELDWRVPPAARFPLILAADVLYEQRSHAPVLELLRLSLSSGGLAAICDPCREVCDGFDRQARCAGWNVQLVLTRWEQLPGRIFLLRRP